MSNTASTVSWITRLPAVGILGMAGFAKVSGDPGSVYLMQDMLGAPEVARYALGAAELVLAIALLVPKTLPYASFAVMLMMLGAIGSHLFKLGISIEVPETAPEGVAASIGGPSLFVMAIVVFFSALITAFLKRDTFPHRRCEPDRASPDPA